MKLNWAERLVVNNSLRVMEQHYQLRWMKRVKFLPPDAVVLEIGCGRGAGAALVLKEMAPAIIHATDYDFKMIRLAGRYLTQAQKERIITYVTDGASLPYRNATFDAIFDFGAIHHIPDWRGAVKEIARVLKTGGTFYVEELYPSLYQNFITRHILAHPTQDRFRSADFRQALETAGLVFDNALELKAIGIMGVLTRQ